VANIDSFCRIAEALRHSMAIVLEKEFHFLTNPARAGEM
jgi:hypothetical protein